MIFNPGLVPPSGGGGGAVVGTYTGDGVTTKTITLDINFEPALVIIQSATDEGLTTIIPNGFGYAKLLGTAGSTKPVRTFAVAISGNQVIFKDSTMPTSFYNNNNTTYYYFAFPKA